MRVLTIIAFLVSSAFSLNGQVVINELMPANASFLADENGNYTDWVELHNTGENSVNLQGWFFTDDIDEPEKWQFPNLVLEAGGFVVVHCTAYENNPVQASFKLKKEGEILQLRNAQQELVDEVIYSCVPQNRSYGRNEVGEFTHFYVPSPAAQNIFTTEFQQISNEIEISHPSGLYEEEFWLSAEADEEVRFTADGSVPDEEDEFWSGSVLLTEQRAIEGISYKPSADDWKEPKGGVFKGYNYKFQSFRDGCPSSELVEVDAFIHPEIYTKHPLPIYSLSFNEEELFGDDGIMVPGATGQNYLGDGEEWERRARLQLIDGELGAVHHSEVDVRIRGRGSRLNSQKSLKLFGRNYGQKAPFDYPFFSDREVEDYRRIVLRSGHSDFTISMLKDILSAELVEELDLDYMEAETAHVFLNGEYWGIMNARENMGKYYLASHHGVNPENLDIVKVEDNLLVALEGDEVAFRNLMQFCETQDLTQPENYEQVLEQIELENFIDYFITEFFMANWDWPQNNQKVWRERTEGAKFRWMFYDCDGCFYNLGYDELSGLITDQRSNRTGFKIFSALLRNSDFRSQFYARYLELLSTAFSPDYIVQKLDSLTEIYEPLMNEHIARWNTPENFTAWKESLAEMRVFAVQRPDYIQNRLYNLFGNPITVYPNPALDELYFQTELKESLKVRIHDFQGRLMLQQITEENEPLDISFLTSGLYTVHVEVGNLQVVNKLIVQ